MIISLTNDQIQYGAINSETELSISNVPLS